MTKDRDYERIELTFSKNNPAEMEIYDYILRAAGFLGKAKYLKQLAEKDMKAHEK